MHVIGTAGHVDHGKSTLVRRLTGIDPDRWAEEKRRGLTIDLGFAWLPLPSGREIGLIDVPGHERFIRNMLAGAGGVSVCLFVVAANEGWMPQSAEHLAILDVLGVSSAVVALTKADLVDADTLYIAREDVQEKLALSSLAGAPVIACSAVTGDGLDELVAAVDSMVGSTPPVPDIGRPRLWVDRVFTISGAGTVVTGTLGGGPLSVGDEVEISPEGRRARVRTIQSHKKELQLVEPGNRVALNLAGLERQGAERGDAIVKPRRWRPTHRIDARIRVLSSALTGVEHELTDRGAHLLYIGSAEAPVRLRLLGAPRLLSGESGYAHIYLRKELPVARGDRFVLRDAGRIVTFGGGEVLDPLAPPLEHDGAARLRLLEHIDGAPAMEALTALVEANGSMDATEAALRSGVQDLSDMPDERVQQLGRRLFSTAELDGLADKARNALAEHHEEHPLERGMPRESLRATTALDNDAFDAFMEAHPEFVQDGAVVRLSSHRFDLAPEQQKARDELFAQIESAGFAPPLAQDLVADPQLIRALVTSGELVRLGDFYLTGRQAADARRQIRLHIESNGPMTVAQIRDLLRTTRKYAVPICEWLDQTGATRRAGDVRTLGPNP